MKYLSAALVLGLLVGVAAAENCSNENRQAVRRAEADLCNTFPRGSKMYKACWCNSTLSGSWRHRICKD